MNTKTVTMGTLAIVALFGLMWVARPEQATLPTTSEAATVSALTANETFYDFGTISMGNGKVTKSFTVTNPTANALTIESITTSCMCTNAFLSTGDNRRGPFGMPGHGIVPKANELVEAGGSRTIEVVYDPTAHGPAGVGPIDRFVYLTDSRGGTLKFEIKAVVTP